MLVNRACIVAFLVAGSVVAAATGVGAVPSVGASAPATSATAPPKSLPPRPVPQSTPVAVRTASPTTGMTMTIAGTSVLNTRVLSINVVYVGTTTPPYFVTSVSLPPSAGDYGLKVLSTNYLLVTQNPSAVQGCTLTNVVDLPVSAPLQLTFQCASGPMAGAATPAASPAPLVRATPAPVQTASSASTSPVGSPTKAP